MLHAMYFTGDSDTVTKINQVQTGLFRIACCLPLMEGFLLASLSSEVCAGLGNGCERFCVSRSLLGSYVHQKSI